MWIGLDCFDMWTFGKKKTRGAFEVDVVPVLVQYLETRNACATDIRGRQVDFKLAMEATCKRRFCHLKPRYHKAVQVATMAAAYLQWKAQSCFVSL